MLHYSFMLFNEQNGTRPLKDIQDMMQQNLSKTNPVHTAKAKAFDLANAIPNSLVSSNSGFNSVRPTLSDRNKGTCQFHKRCCSTRTSQLLLRKLKIRVTNLTLL